MQFSVGPSAMCPICNGLEGRIFQLHRWQARQTVRRKCIGRIHLGSKKVYAQMPNSPMKYLVENISWMNTKGWLFWCLSKPRDIFVLLLTGLVVLCTVSSALLLCHIFLLAALFVAGWVVSAMSRPNLTLPTLAAVTPTSIQPDDEWLSFAVSFKLLANDFGHFSIKSLFCVWWLAVPFRVPENGRAMVLPWYFYARA